MARTVTPGVVPRGRVGGVKQAIEARPMRVALCVDSLEIGGTELNAVRTAERLLARGVDVWLLALRAEGPLVERCQRAGIRVVEFRIPSLWSVRGVGRGFALARLLREQGVQVVHTQDRYTNAFVVPWARVAGVRVIASRRWWDAHPSRGLAVANRIAYRLSHAVVANSAQVAELLHRADGVDRARIVVVPNFLDGDPDPRSGAGAAVLRARLGLPTGATVIGCVANLRPVKDHGTLLEAFALLQPRWPELVLCLVGDGSCRAALEDQARRLGVTSRVVFTGTRTEGVNWHEAFDISVLSSLHEGFPNTVIEAMSAARPVVATDVGGVRDAVTHERTGLLVPAGEPESMAAALGRLVADPGLRSAMGGTARMEAAARFSAEVVIPQIEALYRSHTAAQVGEPLAVEIRNA